MSHFKFYSYFSALVDYMLRNCFFVRFSSNSAAFQSSPIILSTVNRCKRRYKDIKLVEELNNDVDREFVDSPYLLPEKTNVSLCKLYLILAFRKIISDFTRNGLKWNGSYLSK